MQIARIIESHRSEDPELQKKIKKVIEITGTTLDEASMALHSRDNNLEDAITLLTEGGTKSLELEWEQAGKKKKMKNAVSKVEAGKDVRVFFWCLSKANLFFTLMNYCWIIAAKWSEEGKWSWWSGSI